MIYCVECGTANEQSARFCIKCGAELFIPEETQFIEEEPKPTIEEVEPKKKGRKTKEKAQEEPIVEEPQEEVNQEIEPVALEWNAAPPQPERRYVPPVMPIERNNFVDNRNDYRYNNVPQATYVPVAREPERYVAEQNMNTKTKPISTGAYFWLNVLYSIPGIGLIVSIILSIAPANINLKRFSRASLIYRIICITILLIVSLALVIVFQRYGSPWYDEMHGFHFWPGLRINIW